MFKYKVEVKVATNPEMGLGLFSKEFIPKGTIVWEFVEGIDVKISEEKFQTLNDAQKEFFYKCMGFFKYVSPNYNSHYNNNIYLVFESSL
jgi:hypothetical protein